MDKTKLDAQIETARVNIESVINNHNRWAKIKLPGYDETTYSEYLLQKLLSKISRYERLKSRKSRAEWTLRMLGNPSYSEATKMRLNGKIDGKTYELIIDSLLPPWYE